ncbi:nitroreductase family deazaflavin-dependent oxidoreductase [Seongchinamella sediminis]|uniref:Nitroreductase family deazaflavin-dependent oxidoreductase n=1 Tax=Seongchinamella sediminis TaxID=2283635 RepID=A0A3L7DY08_9GAMM|nr:nitroreductase/quinone reductase family protein [Seongchinamella sediminis]RLQ21073.1 nitroreductase family deazaflavin-dependent oxidoreductase [Seongchinamella sediminis]
MSSTNRENMVKPDFMSDEEWEGIKEATASLERIRGDARADVEAYLANPDGRASGIEPGGDPTKPTQLPTLLLTVIGRKSGEKRTTPLVFLRNGDDLVVVGSLAGYDTHPAWYLNISANPDCWVQLDRDRYTAVGRDATAEEREELWPRLVEMFPPWGYFQSQTDRPFSIVILSPTGPA